MKSNEAQQKTSKCTTISITVAISKYNIVCLNCHCLLNTITQIHIELNLLNGLNPTVSVVCLV